MSGQTIIHFVRHGEVDNPNETYYGRLPNFHLSQTGKEQAKSTAKVLERYPIVAVYSSPMERTIETAEVIAAQLNLVCEVSDLLNEVHSPLDGQPMSLIAGMGWNIYNDNEFPFEQPADVLRRGQKFTWNVRQEYNGKHIVAVTHGDVIAFITLWAKRLSITQEQKLALYKSSLTYASISSIAFETLLETETPSYIEG